MNEMDGKTRRKKTSKINPKSNSKIAVEKKISDNSDENVSVITKTRNPNILVQSEKICNNGCSSMCTGSIKLLGFICLITMCIIILATFFLSIRTYNMLNELVLQ